MIKLSQAHDCVGASLPALFCVSIYNMNACLYTLTHMTRNRCILQEAFNVALLQRAFAHATVGKHLYRWLALFALQALA